MFKSNRYANVTATLALVVALGGTSYAATQLPKDSVRSKQIKQNSVKSVDVKDGDLGAQDLAAGVLPVVPSVAFAHIAGNGTVDAPRSKGIAQANVTHPESGRFCFSGLAFTPRSVLANVDYLEAGATPGPIATVSIGATDCPAGTQASVVILNNNVLGDRAFYVLLN